MKQVLTSLDCTVFGTGQQEYGILYDLITGFSILWIQYYTAINDDISSR
jgi:hypothetical protein